MKLSQAQLFRDEFSYFAYLKKKAPIVLSIEITATYCYMGHMLIFSWTCFAEPVTEN